VDLGRARTVLAVALRNDEILLGVLGRQLCRAPALPSTSALHYPHYFTRHMANPRPSTRFEPGHPKYGGRRVGTRNWATVIRAAAPIRSLAAVLADERAFLGTMGELLESVARDPDQPTLASSSTTA
jgi:hypothetical protein